MAMTTEQIEATARALASKMFVEPNETATLDFADLKAAIQAIDDAMGETTTQMATSYPGVSLESAVNQNLPEPFKTEATLAQKGVAMALWAMKRGGLL